MIIGIDLGTTHSLIGCFDGSEPRLFPNALGDYLTPSAVSLDDDGRIIVGQAARDRAITHPATTVSHFKRWMGSARETQLGHKNFRPEELSALVLRSLVADAETALGEKVREAVISVPAYFSDAQRKATRAAGELAGLKVDRLINEPTAGALAYGLTQSPDGSRFLVFDLGGGTFDVSILEMFDGIVEVHATAGDNFLGGEDFLDVLEAAFRKDCGLSDPDAISPPRRSQLRRRLEIAKRKLGKDGQASVSIAFDTQQIDWHIDAEHFASLSDPLLQRMRAPLERAMRDARVQPEHLDAIVLIGGASRMPMVGRMLARMFHKMPMRHVNPDQSVALGACIAAGMKARHERLEEVILTDVCPYTLGISICRTDHTGKRQAGFFEPLIQRNSVVPISREDTVYPVEPGQKQICLEVYQGENPWVERNIKLGELSIGVDPKQSIEKNAVTVRFTYDVNGVLQVQAHVGATDEEHELILEQNPGVLDSQQIRERLNALSELKVHPRDQQKNQALLARAERMYEEQLDNRPTLQDWIARFRGVLETQDEIAIKRHRNELDNALDTLDAD
ncbi:MAG TPA: molecular chaperone HscC [Rhodanobacteraceae bacterium]